KGRARCCLGAVPRHVKQTMRYFYALNPAKGRPFMVLAPGLLCAIYIALIVCPLTPARADAARPNRIRVAYFAPKNAAYQATYELLKERRALEKLQEIFSPLRLPVDLTLQTGDCEGVANAWYDQDKISVCYEYVHEILKGVPKDTTPEGITPVDAVIGQ